MGQLIFSKEDKKEIEKSMGLIIDDIRNLWENSKVDRISIDLRNLYDGSISLEVTDKKIGLHQYWYDSHKYYSFERFGKKGSRKRIPNYQKAFTFVHNYEDEIRPLIVEELKKGLDLRGEGFEKLEAVKQQYDKHAEITFETGDSSNPPIIVLSEEEGLNIGTLYLGSRALKIVVDGPIRIINKTSQEELANVKRKTK